MWAVWQNDVELPVDFWWAVKTCFGTVVLEAQVPGDTVLGVVWSLPSGRLPVH